MDSEIWMLLVVGGLVFLTGFFVAAEYSLVSARKARIDAFARTHGRMARAASFALDNLPQFIAGLQVCITMCSLALGAFGEETLAHAIRGLFGTTGSHLVATVISFLVVTFLTVSIGELVPKYLAIHSPDRWALRLALPTQFILLFVRPLTIVFESFAKLLLKPFKIDVGQKRTVQKEELAALLQESASTGEMKESHAKLVARSLRLTDLQADDIMIPRVDIGYINADGDIADSLEAMSRQRHTRLVVVEDDDLDEIVGILHVQEVFKLLASGEGTIRSVVRPAVFVPPTVTLDRLVETMRSKRTQVLIVRDEHGGTYGLLTLEDIVEEIFGEMDDQLEASAPRIERRSDGRILMRADVRTDELCEFLDLRECPMERENVNTIVLEALNRTPRIGDTVDTPLGQFRVDNMARHRITRVSLRPAPQEIAD